MEEAIVLTYDISADDFTRQVKPAASEAKTETDGREPDAIRKVAIAMYEGEINMVIHAKGGVITVEITTEKIKMILADVGPGIPDVKLAMQAAIPLRRMKYVPWALGPAWVCRIWRSTLIPWILTPE